MKKLVFLAITFLITTTLSAQNALPYRLYRSEKIH